ncbi:kinase-like protein [Rhizoclosmatium globosum]|uniref:non-specific serine/threonine protein kinase n=1 Tax=Rhizoclosmatium globosum TaxID=329046 RepID=A0A1Y2CJY1_9FUNG|nr:kinase-like protein [Rhizoclosmatium globosum]|eukprot:ORY47322.1 kinase-like protein [Rhizoclosmatium globosum]
MKPSSSSPVPPNVSPSPSPPKTSRAFVPALRVNPIPLPSPGFPKKSSFESFSFPPTGEELRQRRDPGGSSNNSPNQKQPLSSSAKNKAAQESKTPVHRGPEKATKEDFVKDESYLERIKNSIRGEMPGYSSLNELLKSEKILIRDAVMKNQTHESNINTQHPAETDSMDSDQISASESESCSDSCSESESSGGSETTTSTSTKPNGLKSAVTMDVVKHETVTLSPILRRATSLGSMHQPDEADADESEHGHHRFRYHHHHHKHFHSHHGSKGSLAVRERKLKQGRLLLVCLLENFCMLYDQSPERNKKLFFTLCKQLSSMGIIDSEDFLDEISSVQSIPRALPSTLSNDEEENKYLSYLNQENGSTSALVLKRPSVFTADFSRYNAPSSSLHDSSFTPTQPMQDLSEILDLDVSRYQEDFEEIRPLGKGGFGQVWCVKNKLDGMEYAVKRVKLKAKESGGVEKILREVKVQARLSHQNVVRYFSCWLEHAKPATKVATTGDEDVGDTVESTDDYLSNTEDLESDEYQSRAGNYSATQWNTRVTITEVDSDIASKMKESLSEEGASNNGANLDENENRDDDDDEDEDFEWDEDIDMEIEYKTPVAKSKHLSKSLTATSIESASLHTATPTSSYDSKVSPLQIKARANHNAKILESQEGSMNSRGRKATAIPRELTLFIQSCIHRDIAPKNIFWVPRSNNGSNNTKASMESFKSQTPLAATQSLSSSLKSAESRHSFLDDLSAPYKCGGYWKIGDFGLVTISDLIDEPRESQGSVSRASTVSSSPEKVQSSKTRTTGVGTVTYASPEQLAPSEDFSYTSKSDMFSVGIVLFEMLHPLGTGMERAQTLTNLRLGVLPEEFVRRWPKEAILILSLMNKNPELRPCAQETLNMLLLTNEKTTATPSERTTAEAGKHENRDTGSPALSHSRRSSFPRLPFVESLTSTIKTWIHHPQKGNSESLDHQKLMEELSDPVKALKMVTEAHRRADKSEQDAREAKEEVDRLRNRVLELESILKIQSSSK